MISKRLDAAHRLASGDSDDNDKKNYFSKNAVPYFNKGSRGSRPFALKP
jgi:hypothetical protein